MPGPREPKTEPKRPNAWPHLRFQPPELALVISSTNNGIPSVRSMISFRTLSGIGLFSATPSIMASTSRSAIRLIVRGVTCCRPIQGGTNSGRNVARSNTAQGSDPVHCPAERFQGRRVGPVRILEDHQHRPDARQDFQLRTERLQRFLPALLRSQIEGRIPSVIGQRQQFGEKRRILGRCRTLAEQGSRACRA